MPIEVNENGEMIAPPVVFGNIRSEAMSEIILRKPGFLGRWALLIFLFIILLLLTATWFIQYPDIIKATATLVANNAPKEIVLRKEGRLKRLFYENNEVVTQNSILGFIESTAKHEQVLLISGYIDSSLSDLQKNNSEHILTRFSGDFKELGEIQPAYQQFMIAYQQFIAYMQEGFYLKKKKVLTEDILYLKKNYAILLQQKEIMQKDLNLSEESYLANESLLKEKIISKQDSRIEQSKLLNKQLSIPQINTSILTNETQQREKQKEITDLEFSISQQKIIFQQAIQTLQSTINDWMKQYILLAPVDGKISFLFSFQEGQYFSAGKLIGYVNPDQTTYYAEVTLPQNNFGKIKENQVAQLRFAAYPYQEFGFVQGQLGAISEIATDSGFLAHIQLPNGLVTNLNKKIQYRNGLKAEAQIITKDMRLMERFYYNTFNMLKR